MNVEMEDHKHMLIHFSLSNLLKMEQTSATEYCIKLLGSGTSKPAQSSNIGAELSEVDAAFKEVGEERGGRGGRLPSSPSDRERRVGSSHGLNWAPIPATHTHRWEVLSSSHITDLVTFLLLLRSGLQSS